MILQDPTTGKWNEDDDAIHQFFGLSYSSYLVLPRVLLQSMPQDWQRRFVDLVDEYFTATRGVEQPDCYSVEAGEEREVWELSLAQLADLGITEEEGEDEDSFGKFHDKDGNEMERWERVIIRTRNPLPPYSRGRTRVELFNKSPESA